MYVHILYVHTSRVNPNGQRCSLAQGSQSNSEKMLSNAMQKCRSAVDVLLKGQAAQNTAT